MTALHDATVVIDQPFDANGRLDVRLSSADVRIVPSTADRLTVRTPGGRPTFDRLIIDTADGAVTIREKETFGLVFAIRRQPTIRLDIALPPSARVATDVASGDVETHGLRGEQHHRSASGDVRLLEGGGEIELMTVSGDATVELLEHAPISIRTVSGDVRVSGGSLRRAQISTTSGDVRLESPLTGQTDHTIETLSGDAWVRAAAGIRVEAKTVSGDLTSELPHRSDGRMGRRTLIVGDGAVRLAFRSVSGDLHVLGAEEISPAAAAATAATRSIAASTHASPGASPEPSVSPGRFAGDAPVTVTAAGQPVNSAEDDRMAILHALERGELDVATAMDRLAALDDGDASLAMGEPTDG